MGVEDQNIVLRSHKGTSFSPRFKFRRDWVLAGRPEQWELQCDLLFARWNHPTPTQPGPWGLIGNYVLFDVITDDPLSAHAFWLIGGRNSELKRGIFSYSAGTNSQAEAREYLPGHVEELAYSGAFWDVTDVGAGPYHVRLRRERDGGQYRVHFQVGDSPLVNRIVHGTTAKMRNVQVSLIPFASAAAVEAGNYAEIVIKNLRLVSIETA